MSIAKYGPIIRKLENSGCPIIGCTYVNREGEKSERDLQINVRRSFGGPLPYGAKISKTMVQHKGQVYMQAIDRNRSKLLRRDNPQMTVEEADKLSFRAFRLDRILSLRYGQKELG